MARTPCAALGLALVLLVGQAAYVHARDQVDVAGLPVEVTDHLLMPLMC